MDSEWSNAPFDGWEPSGSFVRGFPVPSSDPGDSPQVSACWNSDYTPLITGCLQQLQLRQAWDTTDLTALAQAFGKATNLAELLGNPGPCGPTWTEQVWAVCRDTGIVVRLAPDQSQYAAGLTVANNASPYGAAVLTNGQYWLGSSSYPFIKRMDVNGVYVASEIDPPHAVYGLAQIGSNVWYCSYSLGAIYTLSLTGGTGSTITASGMYLPLNIAEDGNGRAWVTTDTNSPGTHTVFVFNADGSPYGTVTPASGGFTEGIAVVNGHMAFVDFSNHLVRVYDYALNPVTTFGASNLSNPLGICQLTSGEIWVGNSTGTIYRFSSSYGYLGSFSRPGLGYINQLLHVPASS